jgi:AcrR family transcriptional regulator
MVPTSVSDRKRVVKAAGERRQEIIQAALKLFVEKGFGETTVQDISQEAGVATGTVYLYFPSKDHVLLALHQEFHLGMASLVTELASEMFERMGKGEKIDYREAIDAVVDAMAIYCQEKKVYAHVCLRHIPGSGLAEEVRKEETKFAEMLRAIYEQATAAGIMHISDPEMAAHLINNAISMTFGNWAAYGEPADFERLIAATKEFLYKVLAPVA